MKLKRDWVITITEDGDRVGVYEAGTCGCEPFFECDPQLANKLISLWNNSPYARDAPDD